MLFDIVERGDLEGLRNELKKLKKQGELALLTELYRLNGSKKTLLHIAAQNGHTEIVRELLLLGLVPDSQDAEGNTPLVLAENNNHIKVAALIRTRIEWQGASKGKGPKFSMSTALSYIEDAFQKIESGRNQDLVLVIGNTGAGKSTLLNYMLGARYKIKTVRKDFIVELVSGEEHARVGNSTTISETLYPQVFKCNGQDFVLCDLAGFGDTRGDEKAVCAASSTQMLTRISKQIKSVLLVLSFDDLKGQRAAAFKDVCKTLSHVLRGDNQLITTSLYFAFTKAEGYSIEEIMKDYVNELLDHPKEGLVAKSKAMLLPDEEQGLLDVLLAMRSNQNRILIPDIADEGQSAEELLAAIKTCSPQTNDKFDFMSHDGAQNTFNNMMFKIAREYKARIQKLEVTLPKSLQEEQARLFREETDITRWKNEITDREDEKSKPYNADTLKNKVNDLKTQIAANKLRITNLESNVRDQTTEKSGVQARKDIFNTDEEIQETELSCMRSGSKHHEKTGVFGLGAGKDVPDEGHGDYPFAYSASCDLSKAVPQVNGGAMTRNEIAGKDYQGNFRYELGKDSSAKVKVMSIKKVKYADQISLCDQLIKRCGDSIANDNAEIQRITQENIRLEQEKTNAQDAINAGEVDYHKRGLELDAEIADRQKLVQEAQTRTALLADTIDQLHKQDSNIRMEIEVNHDLFKIVYDVNKTLQLQDPNDPKLIAEFNRDFEKRQGHVNLHLPGRFGLFGNSGAENDETAHTSEEVKPTTTFTNS